MRDSNSGELWADQVQEGGKLREDNGFGICRDASEVINKGVDLG